MNTTAGEYERAMTSKRVTRQHDARRARGVRWGVDEGPRPLLVDGVASLAPLDNPVTIAE